MSDGAPSRAAASVPPGSWAVGVSGGADSVALLALLCGRPDLNLHVVHLDHQTRQGESAVDAQFVGELAVSWGLPCTIVRRDEIEQGGKVDGLPVNRAARFRAARLALFRQVIAEHGLGGVILAHHADDQAETIFARLLRGSGPAGLAGMAPRTHVGGLMILRPLLGAPKAALREFLIERGIAWREDPSNQWLNQQRNRIRRVLLAHPELSDVMLDVGAACGAWNDWLGRQAPALGESFRVAVLAELTEPLARRAAGRWLIARGVPADEVTPAGVAALLEMASDAAAPARRDFAGGVTVRRRGGIISAASRPVAVSAGPAA
jgi:tRNA(Ile)-lysidine synthase